MKREYRLKDIATHSKGKQINGNELVEDGKYIYLNGGINPSGRWNEFNVAGDTVTISEGGNSSGYVNYIEEPFWCGAHCYYLYNVKGNSKYLYYALKSNQKLIMNLRTGAAMPNLKKSALGEFSFVYDSDATKQNEVVQVLERVELIIKHRNKQLIDLDNLIKSRFVVMFGDPENPSSNFPEYKIGEVCFVTKLAGYEYTKYIKYQEAGEVVMVKAQNVKNGILNKKDISYISLDVSDKLPRSQLKPNDIVMTYVGANIGDLAIIDDSLKYHLAPNVALIRPDSMLNPLFLMYLLMFKREYILGNSADTAKGAISMEKIRNLKIFVPRIEEQFQFAKIVKQINILKSSVQKSLDETQMLYDSLMQEYFR